MMGKNKMATKSSRVLWEILIALIVLILLLIIGIIVGNQLGQIHFGEGDFDDEVGLIESEDESGKVSSEEIVLGDDDEVNGQIIEYQKEMSDTESNEEKANKYWERINYIWRTLGTDAYKEQVISDAKAADGLLETPESALMVVNVGSVYGDQELMDEYNVISDERLKEQGIDPNTVGEGSDRTGVE